MKDRLTKEENDPLMAALTLHGIFDADLKRMDAAQRDDFIEKNLQDARREVARFTGSGVARQPRHRRDADRSPP
jgi:hypothetical protein